MFALSTWSMSGPPSPAVSAPSSEFVSTLSSSSKLPDASVKPIGPEARWSWYLLTRKKASVALCLRLSCQLERSFAGSHVQTCCGVQRAGGSGLSNGVKSNWKSPFSGVTSSSVWALLSSLTSVQVWVAGPSSLLAPSGNQPGVVRSWLRSVPPSGAPR